MNKQKIIIIEERENPSTDFFVLPQFDGDDYLVKRCQFNDVVSAQELTDAIVVFVRYLPKAWRQLISRNRAALQSLYFFMDDDVLDFAASKGMPLRYRFKLLKLAAFHKNWLINQKASLWVSTPFLKQKYQAWSPALIEPQPLLKDVDENTRPVKIFYHGSASHQAEIDWLYLVIKAVLQQCPQAYFEIIGGQSVYKLFKGLERVQVVHPMSWLAYKQFIKQPGRHIGLAPLLNNDFNNARSYTKVFDITSAGAVGIYSKNSESARFVLSHKDELNNLPGLVLPLNQEEWIAEIVKLVKDPQTCQTMVQHAQDALAKSSFD